MIFHAGDGDTEGKAELWEKVMPKVDKKGASYVVKTFSLNMDGAPKIDGLPYEPEEASVAIDYWSLGVLLFHLVAGEPLVPSNRDDDGVDVPSGQATRKDALGANQAVASRRGTPR